MYSPRRIGRPQWWHSGRGAAGAAPVLTEIFACRAGAPVNAVVRVEPADAWGSREATPGAGASRGAAGRGPESETRMKSMNSPFAAACGALALAWAAAGGLAAASERPLAAPSPGTRYVPGCEIGQQQVGQRFCISEEKQGKKQQREAVGACEAGGARLCTSADLLALHAETDLDDLYDYDPDGVWLGDPRADGAASCGVGGVAPEQTTAEFVGACDERDSRAYWCCADL